MIPRQLPVQAGTRKVIDFATVYSDDWSVPAKRGTNVLVADISAARFLLKERLSLPDTAAVITKTLTSGISAVNGSITVTLDPADTDDLQGTYYGTLRLYLTDGAVVDWLDSEYDDVPYIQIDIAQGAVEATS